MNKCVLLGFALLTVSNNAMSKDIDPCLPFYTGIKEVHVSFDAEVPNLSRDTVKQSVERDIKHRRKHLVDRNIKVKLVERFEESSSEIINLHYTVSYIPKEHFTIPPNKSQIAGWVEISRNLQGQDIRHERSPISLLSYGEDSEISSSYVGALFHTSTNNALCKILRYSADTICVSGDKPFMHSLVNGKFKTSEKSCVNEVK